MSLNFKEIKDCHLLSLFGQSEAEETIAAVLAIVGDDITMHFMPDQLYGRAKYWVNDFVPGGYIVHHPEGYYTITQKLVDYINSKQNHIEKLMKRGNTMAEVLGIYVNKMK